MQHMHRRAQRETGAPYRAEHRYYNSTGMHDKACVVVPIGTPALLVEAMHPARELTVLSCIGMGRCGRLLTAMRKGTSLN